METHDDVLRDLYGGDAIDGNIQGGGVELPEDPLQLNFEMNNLKTKRKRSAESLNSSKQQQQPLTPSRRKKKTPIKMLSPVQVMEMQKETKTANGRRRIQPVFLTEAADNFNAKNADLFSGSRNTPVRRGNTPRSSVTKKKKTMGSTITTTTTSSSKKSKKRRIALTSLSSSLVTKKKSGSSANNKTQQPAQRSTSVAVATKRSSPPRRTVSPPRQRGSGGVIQVDTSSQRARLPMTCELLDTKRTLTVRLLRGKKITRCSVTCTSEDDEIVWTDVVDGTVCAVTGNASFSAVAVTDGFVVLYSAAGRRLMAPLALGDTVTMLKCAPQNAFILMALCSRTGHCHVWNVSSRKRLLRAETHELLQSRSSRLFDANVTSIGVPTVHVQDMNEPHRVSAYAYDMSMEAWLRVSSFDRFLESDYFGMAGDEDGALASIERRVHSASGPSMNNDTAAVSTAVALLGSDESDSVSVTRAHLETQLSSSYLLRSSKEFRKWLHLYVEHLRDFKMKALVREMCESCLNFSGIDDDDDDEIEEKVEDSWALDVLTNWKSSSRKNLVMRKSTDIAAMSNDLGMKPKELLENEVLPLLRRDRFWQAIAREFQGLLSSTD